METMTDKWADFYQNRVNNNGYLKYFEKKYYPLIHTIVQMKPDAICEEGIGIGNVSKVLLKKIPQLKCFGFDNSNEMLHLCHQNTPEIITWEDDILYPGSIKHSDVVITHGVLEHFLDHEIIEIMRRYELSKQRNVHYVPTDKYKIPSFGDERLLSTLHWLKLVKPKDYILFNDDHDLLLIN